MALFFVLAAVVAIFVIGYRTAGSGTLSLMGMFAGEGLKRLAIIGLACLALFLAFRFGGQLIPLLLGAAATLVLALTKYGIVALRCWGRIVATANLWRGFTRTFQRVKENHHVYFYGDIAGAASDGLILRGPWRGRKLSSLTSEESQSMLHWLRGVDLRSAAEYEQFLTRRSERAARNRNHRRPGSSTMTRRQAYQLLGLASGADRAEIQKAYVRRMRHCHPDRGGDARKAAQVNVARDILLQGD